MEESKTLNKYCEQFGARDVKLIQAAIKDRHQKERETKVKLISASGAFALFKNAELELREIDH